jgi:hypothetical protein
MTISSQTFPTRNPGTLRGAGYLAIGLVMGGGLLAGGATAEEIRSDVRVVVELFTSQGCASCPPADELLTALDRQNDVIALAYHVDYWDYIGWEDTFGQPAFSERQRAYAAGWGSSRIYTPQMVINGDEHVVGSRVRDVNAAVGTARLDVPVMLQRVDDRLEITVPPLVGGEDAMIWLVGFIDEANVLIERGENAGSDMLYSQVVTHRQGLGLWDADVGAVIKMPISEALASGATGVAILVQPEESGVPGPVLGAALYRR